MKELTASIVLYNNPEEVKELVELFQGVELNKFLYLIDNSEKTNKDHFVSFENVDYQFTGKNLGYGKGHNLAIEKARNLSKYHIILNPDISFEKGEIEKIYRFMEENSQYGHVMPRIIYPDGELQKLCKLLPTPMDMIRRRFGRRLTSGIESNYELPEFKYNKVMEIPNLSGCFMFFRTSVLVELGGFDPRFFMYFEDVDLTRRSFNKSKSIFYPEATIIHKFRKESYKSKKMLYIHSKSAIQYFNKWGWFFDKERKRINNLVLEQIKTKG